jgi:ribosome-associated protein
MQAEEKAKLIAALAADLKARDIIILNLTGISSVTDFFVICSVDSTVQMNAVIERVKAELKKQGAFVWGKEGEAQSSWQLLDCGDVVFHVFMDEARNYYELERLWADATVTAV